MKTKEMHKRIAKAIKAVAPIYVDKNNMWALAEISKMFAVPGDEERGYVPFGAITLELESAGDVKRHRGMLKGNRVNVEFLTI